MRFLIFLTIMIMMTSGCTTFRNIEDSVSTLKTDMIGGGDYEGKKVKVKYVNSAVFDKTLAMLALKNAGVVDVEISKGMSINEIPKRLDDIFVAAVDNGADFNLIDERDEEKSRGIGAIMALVSIYSNYRKVRETYRNYIDDRAQAKLGNYIIDVFYNDESGEISHVKFSHRILSERDQDSAQNENVKNPADS